MLFARMLNARNILEIGTLGAYSTIWMARGMAEGGRLITLEYEAKHAEVAMANSCAGSLIVWRYASAGHSTHCPN